MDFGVDLGRTLHTARQPVPVCLGLGWWPISAFQAAISSFFLALLQRKAQGGGEGGEGRKPMHEVEDKVSASTSASTSAPASALPVSHDVQSSSLLSAGGLVRWVKADGKLVATLGADTQIGWDESYHVSLMS